MVPFAPGLDGTGREQPSRTLGALPRQPYCTGAAGARGHGTGPAHNPKVVGSNPTPPPSEVAGQARCASTGPSALRERSAKLVGWPRTRSRVDDESGDDRSSFDWWRELADELADEGSLARGVVYALDGRVERLEIADRSLTAVVRGSHPYRVTLAGSRTAPRWSCDCPVGVERMFCKHCVAVALVATADDAEPVGPGPDDRRGRCVSGESSIGRGSSSWWSSRPAGTTRSVNALPCGPRLRRVPRSMFGTGASG